MKTAQDQYLRNEGAVAILPTLYENEERRETRGPNFSFAFFAGEILVKIQFHQIFFPWCFLFSLYPRLLASPVDSDSQIDVRSCLRR